jgi:hypothetical protein
VDEKLCRKLALRTGTNISPLEHQSLYAHLSCGHGRDKSLTLSLGVYRYLYNH